MAIDYGSSFNFGGGPRIVDKKGVFAGKSLSRTATYQDIEQGQQDKGLANALNEQMAGHNAKTDDYLNQLDALLGGYNLYAQEYGDKAKPLIDFMNSDLAALQGHVDKYSQTLNQVAPSMLNGIKIDPSATRTREEYQGNVAKAFGKQREQLMQSMAGQGLNPHGNTGAARQLALSEAATSASEGNRAFSDWKRQYNNDMATKGQLAGQYAGLVSQQAGLQNNVMQGRGRILDAEKSVIDAKMGASQMQQAGLESKMGLQESRRQETLGLAQQAQNNARTNADINQQLQAKLTKDDKRLAAGKGVASWT